MPISRFSLFSALAGLLLLSTSAVANEPASEAVDDEAGFESMHPVEGKSDWEKGVTTTEEGYLGGGGRYMKRTYSDFVLRFDFQQKPAANSGIGLRCDKTGNMAYQGMECQVLEDSADVYKNIQPWQSHGSIYGVVAAKRGALKKPGEWNTEEIHVEGDHIKVTLNGTVIVDADIRKASENGTLDGKKHPGLLNKSGYIGIAGHGGGVNFRNMRVKVLNEDQE